VGEGEGRATRSGGGESRRLPKLPEGNLSLSADFWLARGIDDVTVQKSADSVLLNAHTANYWCFTTEKVF